MITKTLMKQLRICELIIICVLAKSLYGKPLNKLEDPKITSTDARVKRGYSHLGENEFGPSVHISSGVLQYSDGGEHSLKFDSESDGLDTSLDIYGTGHLGSDLESSAGNGDSWTAGGLAPGYDVWLEALPDYHTSSVASQHPGSDHLVNTVFSDDTHTFELPKSHLHTQIGSSSRIGNSAVDISSSVNHGNLGISDNIDFNNDVDINTKHYAKSYGK